MGSKRYRKQVAAAAVTLTVAAASAQTLTHRASAADQHDGQQAQVYITTPDGTKRMAQQGPVSFGPVKTDADTVTVEPDVRQQRMEGFGAALTDSSASVLASLPADGVVR